MPDSRTSSPHPSSESQHFECTCQSCGHRMLAKRGAVCVICGGVLTYGDEVTRKTFGRDDNDLIKAG